VVDIATGNFTDAGSSLVLAFGMLLVLVAYVAVKIR
jgi:hypothetical protein